MKKNRIGLCCLYDSTSNFLLKMKLLTFLIFVSVASVTANSYSQQTKFNLSLENITVRQAFKEIENHSEFIFLYSEKSVDVNRKVDVKVENESVEKILDQVFKGTGNFYEIHDRQIAIMSNDAPEIPVVLKNPANAEQKKELSGTVKDDKGLPLPGVTVYIKGSTTGTITDDNGNYKLTVPNEAKTLLFSFIGMKTQEVTIGGKTGINIVMVAQTEGLDEVVVVGYGTIRRKDLIGSISSVSGAKLQEIPVASAAQAMVGQLPGVNVTASEGGPDAKIQIRVRGGGSITQDNSPLLIVDGFPVDNINNISTSDISSIDVLKDASSTAIYGARGANGVVIITTKSGFEGKTIVNYNMYYGVKKAKKFYDVFSPYDYVLMQREQGSFTDSDFQNYFGMPSDIPLYKEIQGDNWQKQLLGKIGSTLYNNLSVSGGSKTVKFNIGLTRNDDKDIMDGSGFKLTTLTARGSYTANNWLTLEMNTRLSDKTILGNGTSSGSSGAVSSPLSSMIQYRPTTGLMDYIDNGSNFDFDPLLAYLINPVTQTRDMYRNSNYAIFYYAGAANIKFSEALSYRFEGGVQYDKSNTDRFYGLKTGQAMMNAMLPLITQNLTNGSGYRLANLLNYNKKNILPGSNITIMLGEELNFRVVNTTDLSIKKFPAYIDRESALANLALGSQIDPILNAIGTPIKTSSFFGRINYDYKGKYLATATLRADGSSRFAPGKQWGYFPSAGLAWRISDENFMKESKKWLSQLKMRASYGQSGNDRIASDGWRKVYSVRSDYTFLTDEITPTPYFKTSSTTSNPDLKWETTVSANVGLDFGLFSDRLSGTIEVYKNRVRDLLLLAAIPANTGFTNQYQNIGNTSNKGIELSLKGLIYKIKDLEISGSFNIAFNKNNIDKLGETKSWTENSTFTYHPSADYLIKEGGPIGEMYGYAVDGMYTFDDFTYNPINTSDLRVLYTLKPGIASNNSLTQGLTAPGGIKFTDQNHDGVLNATDKVVLGNAYPKHTGGFNLTAKYKGFDFSAFFNWSYGNSIYNANRLSFTFNESNRSSRNYLNIMNSDRRFMYMDPNNPYVLRIIDPVALYKLNKNATIWSPMAMAQPQLTSFAIEDGSFLRLNTLTIGYSLPKNLLSRLQIEQLRIYVSGYNLWVLTNYTGDDPEVSLSGNSLTPGVDFNAYPRSRNINIGLNLSF
jgi:TonB-linked SusC/RagA family outer membrane protein